LFTTNLTVTDTTASVGFGHPGFQRQPVYALPALSSDPLHPMVFGGTGSEQFVGMSYDYSESLVIDTSTIVQAKAIISPADDFVYYVELGGIIHQAKISDLSDTTWSSTGGQIQLAKLLLICLVFSCMLVTTRGPFEAISLYSGWWWQPKCAATLWPAEQKCRWSIAKDKTTIQKTSFVPFDQTIDQDAMFTISTPVCCKVSSSHDSSSMDNFDSLK
jgi:hypothetical protein